MYTVKLSEPPRTKYAIDQLIHQPQFCVTKISFWKSEFPTCALGRYKLTRTCGIINYH